VQVTVSSDNSGSVMFDVLNELMEDVQGASITFQHQKLLELTYRTSTASDGTVLVADIPEGRYTYNVSATGHLPASGVFTVEPGIVTAAPVAMQVDLVSIEWSVTPVVIEDRYEITITQTFEPKVPAPVLVVEPPKVHLPEREPGEVFQGEFKVTNYGLVGVYDVALEFPGSFGEYDVEVLAGAIPDEIGAMESVTVPYRITRRVQTASAHAATSLYDEVSGYGGVPCQTNFYIKTHCKSVLCPDSPQESIAERIVQFVVTLLNYGTDCGSTRITTDGGGGTYSGGGLWQYQSGGGLEGGNYFSELLGLGDPCCGKNACAPCDSEVDGIVNGVCLEGVCTALEECKVCRDGAIVDKTNFACVTDVGLEINGKPYDGEKDYAYVPAGAEIGYKAVVQPSGEYGYEWKLTYGGNTSNYHEETIGHTFNVPGEYTVELTVNETGCEEEDCGSVTQVFNIRAFMVQIMEIQAPCEELTGEHKCAQESFVARRDKSGDTLGVNARIWPEVYTDEILPEWGQHITWDCGQVVEGVVAEGDYCTGTMTPVNRLEYFFIPTPPVATSGRTEPLTYRVMALLDLNDGTEPTLLDEKDITQDNLDELRQEYEDMPQRISQERTAFDQDTVPSPSAYVKLLDPPDIENDRHNPWHILRFIYPHAIEMNNLYKADYEHDAWFIGGYRCPRGNVTANGAATSNHQYGRALDFDGVDSLDVYNTFDKALEAGAKADTYMWVDGGPKKAYWYQKPPPAEPVEAPIGEEPKIYFPNYTSGHAAWVE
jgi:hypothetical protein